MTQPAIQTIGTAVPPNKIAQQDHYEMLVAANGLNRAENLLLKTIYSKSGIEHRHSVLAEFGAEDQPENLIWHPSGKEEPAHVADRMKIYEQYALGLCAEAVENCLAGLPRLSTDEITHVISFSCTGMYAPGLDIELVERFGLRRNVERTCINFMGCYAAINALKSAYHIARSEPDAVVLIAGVELCSLHYQKSTDPNQVVANALFSDGAAAAIISARTFTNAQDYPRLRIGHFYSEFEPAAAADMVWRIGDAGFDLRLSPEVPAVVNGNIRGLVDRLLDKAGIAQEDLDYYAIHPGGVKILSACETALDIPAAVNEHSYKILREYGNMSSVTVLFVLKDVMETIGRQEAGKNILACAFGPGITMESVLLTTY